MKKILVALVALLCCPMALAAYSQTNDGVQGYDIPYGDVYVVQSSYDPFPASPGQYVDVWYKVENRGDAALKDVRFILLPEFPFSLDSDPAEHLVGPLDAHQSALIKYRVRVAEDALQGDMPLKYTWRAEGNDDAPTFTSTVSVRSSTALLVVSDVSATPSQIAPGEESTVSIELTNVGDAFVRYATVRLGLFDDDGETGLPFVPLGGGTSSSVVNLAPGKKAALFFQLAAEPDAASRPYRIPLIVNYVDSEGKNITRREHVGVRVGAEPELTAYVDRNVAFEKGKPLDVSVRFVNRGVSDVKFLTVTLQSTDAFQVLTSPAQYVGEIESDDYESASYSIKVLTDKNELQLPFVLTYQDANNERYSTGMTVEMPLLTKSDLGQENGNGSMIFIVLIVVVVIGIIIWRRRARRAKRKN